MIDLEQRLRRTFSSLAANESLGEAFDEIGAAAMLKWSEEIAEQHVRQTGEMEDDAAEEFLAPSLKALRQFTRSLGKWLAEPDPAIRAEWWTRIQQHVKVLFGEQVTLPSMEAVLAQLPVQANAGDVIALFRNLLKKE